MVASSRASSERLAGELCADPGGAPLKKLPGRDVTTLGLLWRRSLEHVDEKRGVAFGGGGLGARGGLGAARAHHTNGRAHGPREQRQHQQRGGCRRDSMSPDELA